MSDEQPANGPASPGGPGSSSPGEATLPSGLVSAVVNLVNTGPVLLGAYTIAELIAVDAIVDFLEARPSDEVLAEAVRSLAARELLLAGSTSDQVQVRGDLGIAVAFQQRARMVLDARATGTGEGEPWRILLLPQPERICMIVRIDALGVHQIGLYTFDNALQMLLDWLPKGSAAEGGREVDADALLSGSERSALVTVTQYTAEGSAEIAGESTDLVVVRHDGRLHLLNRDPQSPERLVRTGEQGRDGARNRITELLSKAPAA
ncbi:hypothetical protein [Streptomyces sp. NPDC020917]|uniref:hypothetical protein n=1 Tax=Streptomyces sp. NPDC020917 TaxID=3365102 RepID=UPI0037A9713C